MRRFDCRTGHESRFTNHELGLESKRVEIRAAVVIVLSFGAFQEPDYLVRYRREYDFHGYLGHKLGGHHERQLVVGNDAAAIERERVEENRIDRFTSDGGADGARPQPPARG